MMQKGEIRNTVLYICIIFPVCLHLDFTKLLMHFQTIKFQEGSMQNKNIFLVYAMIDLMLLFQIQLLYF